MQILDQELSSAAVEQAAGTLSLHTGSLRRQHEQLPRCSSGGPATIYYNT
jgi:hypothetical protein